MFAVSESTRPLEDNRAAGPGGLGAGAGASLATLGELGPNLSYQIWLEMEIHNLVNSAAKAAGTGFWASKSRWRYAKIDRLMKLGITAASPATTVSTA